LTTLEAERATLSEVNMRIMWDVAIPMDDGVELRANVYLPAEDGSFPVVMSMTNYAKDMPFSQGYKAAWDIVVATAPEVAQGTSTKYISFEAPDPEKWVVHGYAIVVMDSRGVGGSPGVVDSWSARERRDFGIGIDWVGEQPWCNGNVGTLGMSYLGCVQWLAGSEQPKHLKGMIPWEAPDDHLRTIGYNGGVPGTFLKRWAETQVKSVQHGLGSRGMRNEFTGRLVSGEEELSDDELQANINDIYEQVMQHPLDDGFYEGRRADFEKITVPLLSVTTWGAQGIHLRGNLEGFMRSASEEKWLVVREAHGTFAALYNDDGLSLQRRFFDYTLKGEGDFAQTQPKVELWIRDVNDQTIERRAESEWPLARTDWTKLYLDPAASTLSKSAPKSETSTAYRAFGEGVTLMTEPLEQETEITGPMAAKLFASASTPDADIYVVVRLFDENENEVFFHGMPDPTIAPSFGWLRASQRELDPERSEPWRPFLSHKTVKPLWPGKVYELDIEVWPTCIVVPAGYRLGLTILGQDWEHDQEPFVWGKSGLVLRGSSMWFHDDPQYRPPDIYDNEVTIHSGPERASYLLVPVVPKA